MNLGSKVQDFLLFWKLEFQALGFFARLTEPKGIQMALVNVVVGDTVDLSFLEQLNTLYGWYTEGFLTILKTSNKSVWGNVFWYIKVYIFW